MDRIGKDETHECKSNRLEEFFGHLVKGLSQVECAA